MTLIPEDPNYIPPVMTDLVLPIKQEYSFIEQIDAIWDYNFLVLTIILLSVIIFTQQYKSYKHFFNKLICSFMVTIILSLSLDLGMLLIDKYKQNPHKPIENFNPFDGTHDLRLGYANYYIHAESPWDVENINKQIDEWQEKESAIDSEPLLMSLSMGENAVSLSNYKILKLVNILIVTLILGHGIYFVKGVIGMLSKINKRKEINNSKKKARLGL